jgi:hypothetical protein
MASDGAGGLAGQRGATADRSQGGRAYLLQVAMTAGPFMMDHLFLSASTTVKQLGLPPFQVVQYPLSLSFQLPSLLTPPFPVGTRMALPPAV